MRSGSTLLKSLLSVAPDTSHLPEVDFQRYVGKNSWKLRALSKSKIIILKKPATYHDPDYPQIPPLPGHKKIVLVRDVYDTVQSLKKMNNKAYPHLDAEWTYDKLVREYWYPVYKNIADKIDLQGADTLLVRYEDLIDRPLEETQKIFHFIGSVQQEGVDRYEPPRDYQWQWGKDDGGPKIKSLKVQAGKSTQDNKELLDIIRQFEPLGELRKYFGYH